MAKVALVGPEIEENLSLRYIAASLSAAGVESDIVPFNSEEDFGPALSRILTTNPDVVGVSLAFQWRAKDFLALCVALKEAGFPGHVTVGGHFATFAAEEIMADFPELDSIIRQEAEETMVALVAALSEGRSLREVPGLFFREARDGERGAEPAVVSTGHPPLPDIAKLPWPDRRGAPAACFGHGIAPLVSSRGCYANCSFCCIAAWHEESLPGKRYRIRDVDDVAREMVHLQRTRGIDIFVFHDDNFFVPGHKKNLERFNALADALEKHGIGEYATVVKARPTDVDPKVFDVLVRRLHCIRAYIGIETDADQGLETLRRWAHAKQNRTSIETVRRLDLYTCFNMLIFDPDTTIESLETNIAFLRYAPEFPSNFGRVELYAGTPLLHRMKEEQRVNGDYMEWDYALGSRAVERVFNLSMRCFMERNFGADALSNKIMGTRFDIEVVRKFHPADFRAEWAEEGKRLSRELTLDGANALEEIVNHVKATEAGATREADAELVSRITKTLRATEDRIRRDARALASRMLGVIKRGAPLTDMGDRVATSLQTQRAHAFTELS